jgi:HSP20 family protein
MFPIDHYRSDEHCVVHAELAGIDPGSLEVTLSPAGELAISAYRSPREDDQLRWTAHERTTGLLHRRIQLGTGLDVGAVQATHSDGVLTVTVPLAEPARRRRISVARSAPG